MSTARRWSRTAAVAVLVIGVPLALLRPDPAAAPRDATLPAHGVIVHLFEWPWADVATECTDHLGPAGVAAVQVSPPQEHIVLAGHPWWQRYQPVSYQLDGRGGDRAAFAAMVRTCAEVGVDIYVDAVINHMTGHTSGVGSAGTRFRHYDYPGLYTPADFHQCDAERPGGPVGHHRILNWHDRYEVQHCELLGLADLATGTEPVREAVAGYLNDLLDLGVAGFRIDAAKHTPVEDLAAIIDRLDHRPVIYSEVLYGAGEPVQPPEYREVGALIESRYGPQISRAFRTGHLAGLTGLADTGAVTGFEPSDAAVVYVDSHDTQRDGALSYADGDLHTLAMVFMLGWPYGTPMVMSGFDYTHFDDSPPATRDGRTLPVACAPGAFVCEHRQPAVVGMVGFRAATGDAPVTDWWAESGRVGFARHGAGYLMINLTDRPLSRTVVTGLPEGAYCDVVAGPPDGGACAGSAVAVDADGQAVLSVPAMAAVAVHRDARADP